jgi:hydroxypyruvate isomerase
MARFSINVSMMLREYPFLDRIRAAADLGFAGIDIQFPYDVEAKAVARAVHTAGVEVVLFNVSAGDFAAGVGLASTPGLQARFRAAVETARGYTDALGNRRVNVIAGCLPEGVSRAGYLDTLVENLGFAAEAFAPLGVTVMLEPLNGRDVPGFLLQTTESAREVIARVGGDRVKIQFDVYHRQRAQGEIIAGLRENLPHIAHIQFADNPGRHEPGTGEINFDNLFAAIDASGYAGWVGAEYLPIGATADSLGWFHRARR